MDKLQLLREEGVFQTDVAKNEYVGWAERFLRSPTNPNFKTRFCCFGFVGLRDRAAQPNLHAAFPHQFESHPQEELAKLLEIIPSIVAHSNKLIQLRTP